MSRAELSIGDKCKQYVKTVMGECIGCIECEVAQDLSGEKILVIKDSHGGVGYLSNGATGPL